MDPSNGLTSRMERVTRTLLDSARPIHELRPEVLELADILLAAAGFSIDPLSDISLGQSSGPGGLALSPTMAAMCAADYARTVAFLRGLHAAIGEAGARKPDPDQPIRVLDAGCGPLGLLSVPLMAVLPDCVRFTMIDTHTESVRCLERLLEALGLVGRVDHVLREDAVSMTLDPLKLPDVIVTEAMQAGLEKEPQVAISRNLIAQAPDATLIPERVRLTAVLVDPAKEFGMDRPTDEHGVHTSARCHIPVGTLFELSKPTIAGWVHAGDEFLPGHAVRLPDLIPEPLQLMLFTEIRVFGPHTLGPRESGLTIPRVFPVDGPIGGGDRFEACYRLGDRPGLVVEPATGPDGSVEVP